MNKQDIKEGILFFISNYDAVSLKDIKKFLELNNIQGLFEQDKYSLKKLREILEEMDNEELIEIRIFGGPNRDERVDYILDNKGIKLLDKNKEKELIVKWNMKGLEDLGHKF